jgi:GT2 family glycosyltransferase
MDNQKLYTIKEHTVCQQNDLDVQKRINRAVNERRNLGAKQLMVPSRRNKIAAFDTKNLHFLLYHSHFSQIISFHSYFLHIRFMKGSIKIVICSTLAPRQPKFSIKIIEKINNRKTLKGEFLPSSWIQHLR